MAAIPPDLPIRPFPGAFPLGELVCPPNAAFQPQRDALAQGRLVFQVCGDCGRWRGLVAPVCPFCGGRSASWAASQGSGRVVSWVRYHRAYLDAFKPLVPYVVLCVELDEGVRIFGRLARVEGDPVIGMRVSAIIERWEEGGHAPAFVLAGEH